jgi:hypothetical protein
MAIIAGSSESLSAPRMSSFRKTVWKSGALKKLGGAVTCPRSSATIVTKKIPARDASELPRVDRMTMTTRPRIAMSVVSSSFPSLTKVTGSDVISPAFRKPDEREEDADSGGCPDSQFRRNRFCDCLANRRHGDQQKEHAGPEDNAERHLPPDLLRQNYREREEGVDAHAGRDRERQFRVEAHQQRHREADQDRCSESAAEGDAGSGCGEDRRVHDHDVGHREEGGDAGDRFGAKASRCHPSEINR